MNKANRIPLLIILLVLAAYLAILFRNQNESERRSLQLKGSTQAADYVLASIRIVDVSYNSSEMTARVRFRLAGKIGKDQITPTADLKVLINSIRGPQEFTFRKGERLSPIEVTFALDGNVNKYPFDRHESNIRMLITTPSRKAPPPVAPSAGKRGPPSPIAVGDLMVGASALERNEAVPIVLEFYASVPGVRFQGQIEDQPIQGQTIQAQTAVGTGEGIAGVALRLSRADQVIMVSIFMMVLMMSLAVGVLLMAARSMTGEQLDLLPLTMSITLTFGLPALRNVQPGVPPIGAFGDYVSFIWAEVIVALSAVLQMVTWLLRSRKDSAQNPK